MNTMLAAVAVPSAEGASIELREMPVPQAGPGEVLIRVRAAGLNRGEQVGLTAFRTGTPRIMGIECAGEIAALGPGVEGLKEGDAVLARGAAMHAGYARVDARLVMRKPARLSWAQGACFPNAFTTAHDALITHGQLRAGQTALINAASSGVGMAGIQIARWAGASTVIATSRSADKLRALVPLGITHPVVGGKPSWIDAVMAVTHGRGVDVLADCIGASVFEDNLKVMALEGRLIQIGRLGGKTAPIDLDFLALRRISIVGVTFRTRIPDETIACVQACARDLLGPMEAGEITPVVDRSFELAHAVEAAAHLMSDAQTGKIALDMP
jgi:NADPH:quinone reductase-like Zn-dependent oxidoreductase